MIAGNKTSNSAISSHQPAINSGNKIDIDWLAKPLMAYTDPAQKIASVSDLAHDAMQTLGFWDENPEVCATEQPIALSHPPTQHLAQTLELIGEFTIDAHIDGGVDYS